MMRHTLVFSALFIVLNPFLAAEAQDVGVPGNLIMRNSSSTEGNVIKGGNLFMHNAGVKNTFLGSQAGNLTLTGGLNTGIGEAALQSSTTGSANTGIGAVALYSNTSGEDNSAVGMHALFSNTTGSNNTAAGVEALFTNTTGINNTASGVQALHLNTTGQSNSAAGSFALVSNTTGDGNTANGFRSLMFNTSGTNNTATGSTALLGNTTGSFNTAIGTSADVGAGDLTNATAIGASAVVDASNKIRLGNAQVTVIEGEVSFTSTSDRNKKENFQPVDGKEVLAKIRDLPLTSWNFIGHDPKRFRHCGPIAQDFYAAFGNDGIGTIGTPTTITSGDLDGILMIAAQALEKRTLEQEKELSALKAKNAELERRLASLGRQQ